MRRGSVGCGVAQLGCGVAQLVVRRPAVRQARVQTSARHTKDTDINAMRRWKETSTNDGYVKYECDGMNVLK